MATKEAPAPSNIDRRDRLTGRTIANRYVIERLIARGGMAAVYQAQQLQLKRKVAIKILRPPPDSDESASFYERFRLEAETLAHLNHPNIVTVYDHGAFDDDQVFLAMEYVDGLRLTDVLREGPLPVDRSLMLLSQVCEALLYAHRRGVVHRDLKPSNLLITRTDDGEELLKVVDFGLVKLTEVDVTITSAGLILGSPHCMAPEQVRGQEVDARTDIYALGILLFRCLTGSYPFHGANSTATMIAHLNQPTPTFFSVSPDLDVPEGLEQVVRRCLHKNPAERYRRMEDVQEAMSGYMTVQADQYRSVAGTATIASTAVLPPQARGAGRSAGIWLALAGLAGTLLLLSLAALGVMAGLQLVGRKQDPSIVLQPGAGLDPGGFEASSGDGATVAPGEARPAAPAAGSEVGSGIGPPEGASSPDNGAKSPDVAESVVKPAPRISGQPVNRPSEKPKGKAEKEDAKPPPDKVKVGSEFADDFDAW